MFLRAEADVSGYIFIQIHHKIIQALASQFNSPFKISRTAVNFGFLEVFFLDHNIENVLFHINFLKWNPKAEHWYKKIRFKKKQHIDRTFSDYGTNFFEMKSKKITQREIEYISVALEIIDETKKKCQSINSCRISNAHVFQISGVVISYPKNKFMHVKAHCHSNQRVLRFEKSISFFIVFAVHIRNSQQSTYI